MGAGGETSIGDFQGRDGSRRDIVGNGFHPPKRERGLHVNWDSRGVVEGVLSCG